MHKAEKRILYAVHKKMIKIVKYGKELAKTRKKQLFSAGDSAIMMARKTSIHFAEHAKNKRINKYKEWRI